MSNSVIGATLKLNTEGLVEANKVAGELNNNLTKAQSAAKGLSATKFAAAAAKRENEDYGVTRSLRPGGTGASARDFAQEAQGLGGLVRLYATWAANIFAVSAAFNLLNEAAAKTRMIEASEKMSIRVGTNLNSLAKSMQEATKYAISLEEAMQFTAMGTSAGIAADQLKNLVTIAKGAAVALNRDTTDSVRRIIQGTAKQEQEILDELGIFVKAKDAYEKYAKEVGIKGGADALSAQQKVVAYSKAVEEAGNKWKEFATIDDPFSTFTAKGKESIQEILAAVNKLVVPVLSFLNQTEGGITSLALLIATVLTKRALPELGTAIRDAFSFDKFAKQGKAQEAVNQITQEIKNLATEEDKYFKKNAEATEKLLSGRQSTISSLRNMTGEVASSYKTISTGIFGSQGSKDVSNLKTIESVHANILKSLTSQVNRVKDQEGLVAKLVKEKLLEAGSTKDNLVLGERGKQVAQDTFNIIKAQAGIQKQIVDSIDTADALSSTRIAKERELAEAMERRAKAGKSLVGDGAIGSAFKGGLSQGSKLAQDFNISMEQGTLGLRGFLSTLTTIPTRISEASVGLTGFAKVAATTGSVISVLGTTLGVAFNAFLGPIMIAMTLWGLFGDKIKDLIGITNEYSRAADKIKEINTQSAESARIYSLALDRVNQEKVKAISNAKEYDALLDREANAANQLKSSSEERLRQLDDEISKLKILQEQKRTGGKTDSETLKAADYYTQYKDALKAANNVQTEHVRLLLERSNAQQRVLNLLKQDTTQESTLLALKEQQRIIEEIQIKLANPVIAQANQEQKIVAEFASITSGFEKFDADLAKLKEKIKGNNPLEGFKNEVMSQGAELGLELARKTTAFANQLDLSAKSIVTAMVQSREGFSNFADSAKKMGIETAGLVFNMVRLQSISEQMLKNVSNPAVLAKLQDEYKAVAEQLSTTVNKIVADMKKSPLNVDPSKTKAQVEYVKVLEDQKLKVFEKTYATRLDLEKRTNDQSLRLLDIKEEGYRISTEDAATQRLALIENAEKTELDIIRTGSAERQAIAQERMSYLTSVYLQNLKLAGNDSKARKDLTDRYIQDVANAQTALTVFYELQDKRKVEISNSAELRQEKQFSDLTKRIYLAKNALIELTEYYQEFWLTESRRQSEAAADRAFERTVAYGDPKVLAGMRAEREELKRLEAQVQKFQDKIVELKKLQDDPTVDPISAVMQVALAEQNLERLLNKIPELAAAAKAGAEEAFQFTQDTKFQTDISEGIVTAMFDGGKEGSKKIRDTLKNKLREPITIIVNALVNPFIGAVSAGLSSLVTGTIQSIGSSVGSSLLSSFGTAAFSSSIKGVGVAMAEGFKGTVSSWLGGSGTSFGASAIETGMVPGASSTGFAVGQYLPYAAVAAVVLNVLGVFRKTKQVQSAITGILGEGDIKDVKVMRKSGTLLSGPKYWVEELGVNKASSMIQEAFSIMKNNTIDMAKSLGLATDQVKNFTTTLGSDKLAGLNKTGLSLTDKDGKPLSEQEVQSKINEALNTANNELAELIIGSWETTTKSITKTITDTIGSGDNLDFATRTVTETTTEKTYKPSEFAKLNETAIETLTRLATSLNTTNGFFELINHTMFEASLVGADMASKLIDAVGSMDEFNQQSMFFFENFFSESEQFDMKSKTLNAGLKRLADDDSLTLTVEQVNALTDSSGNAKEEFKNLVLAQDLTTEAGRKTYAALMDVAPAFVEVANSADAAGEKTKELASSVGLAAESLASTITSSFMDGVNGAEIGKVIANTIQRGMYQAMIQGVSDQIAGLVTSQIITPMLTSIVTSGTIVGAVSRSTIQGVVEKATQMITALAEVLNSPAFQSVIAQLGNLANINFGGISVPEVYTPASSTAAEDAAAKAAEEALKLLDTAFSNLKKSVDAQKKILNEQLKTAEDQLDQLKRVYDVLAGNIRSLRDSVTSTAELSAIQAQQYINSILSTGIVGDPDKLSEAIDSVRSRIDEGNYESKFEADRAKLILAGQLEAIQLMTDVQMTDSQIQIAALTTQIDQLDSMLELYQQQIDAIKGVDSSVKSVAEAMQALEAAMAAAIAAVAGTKNPSAGSSGSGSGGFVVGGGGGPTILGGKSTSTPGGTKDFYTAGQTFTSTVQTFLDAQKQPIYVATINGQEYTASGGGSFNANEYLSKNSDITAYLDKYGYAGTNATNDAEFAAWHFKTYGIAEGRQYADGGIFSNGIVKEPTVFDMGLMGEAGAEAIMPLTRGSDGSLGVVAHGNTQAQLVEEIRYLREQNDITQRQLAHILGKVAKSTEESRRLLDEVVRGGEAITVTSEIATY